MGQTDTPRPSRRPGARLAALSALLLALPPAAAQTPQAPPADDGAEVTVWLQVADARGRPRSDLEAAALTVIEDALPRPVVEVSPAPPRLPRMVVYFDHALATAGTARRGAEALGAAIEALTAFGEVELVIADPEPRSVMTSRDPLALGERLGWLAAAERGPQGILAVRRAATQALVPPAPVPAPSADQQLARVRQAADEERELIAERQLRLLAWAAEAAAVDDPGPRVLFLVSDGFDLDPMVFYSRLLDPAAAEEALRGAPQGVAIEAAVGAAARALAASGWTVMPLVVEQLSVPEGELEAIEVHRPQGDDSGFFPGVARTRQDFRSLFRRRGDDGEAAAAEPALLSPGEPLERLASATGGSVLRTVDGVRQAVSALAGRVFVRYRSGLALGAESVPLEVRAADELTVRGRRWVSRSAPPAFVEARLLRLAAGDQPDGGFDVAAALRLEGHDFDTATDDQDDPDDDPDEVGDQARGRDGARSAAATLEARLSIGELAEEARAGLGDRSLRVTVALLGAAGIRTLGQEVLSGQDLRSDGEWRYQRAVDLPADADQVAVVIEDLALGHWGGSLAAVVRADPGAVAVAVDATPRPAVIEIVRPEQELLRGRVRFAARAFSPRVARVSFLLDDAEVAAASARPFAARVDLGRTPRRRLLTAVALDAAGAELGRHTVALNAGSGGLGVDIVAPQVTRVEGAVDVEAEVTVPIERRLDRVLFFWNNQSIATFFTPPFRQRLVLGPGRPAGYVRVVAMLDDGTVAEDVLFLNGPEAGDRVDVNLVELYVVVTDRQGRPVRDLPQDRFTVRENGVQQEVATFSDASDLPLTLGLAIDSSASMFVKLPNVQQAAVRFLESTFAEQDRAFVVDFDSQPRLARGTTGELARVVGAIRDLQADGRTALWESLVFSLVQLQGVRGRKALVVFSDGADEDDEFPYRACLKFAKRMGVPIYMILMKKEPDRESTGLSLFSRSFTSRANRLVEAVGGRVFYAKEFHSLDEVYRQIEIELRSQYLLAYYPRQAGGAGGDPWRDIDVEVRGSGLTPRTLSGYWQ